MTALRRHLLRHRTLAAWAIALALFMRLVVPTGFMVVPVAGVLTIQPCSGFAPKPEPAATHAMAEHHDPRSDHGGGHGKMELPCAFAGLADTSLAAADPLPLAAALPFAVAPGLRLATGGLPIPSPFLRPPPRGPPARA